MQYGPLFNRIFAVGQCEMRQQITPIDIRRLARIADVF